MSFHYQKLIKLQNKIVIISALYEKDKRFGELLQETDISRTILSKRIKELQQNQKVSWIPDLETKRAKYHLKVENLDHLERAGLCLEIITKRKINHLKKLSKEDTTTVKFFKEFSDITIEIMLLRARFYNVASAGIYKEYIKITHGLEFLRNIDLIISKPMLPKMIELVKEAQSKGEELGNTKDADKTNQILFLNELKEKLKNEFSEDIMF